MTEFDVNLQSVGYALAALAYLFLSALLLSMFRGRLQGGVLAIAAGLSAFWALTIAYIGFDSGPPSGSILLLLEAGYAAIWLFFLAGLLGGADAPGRFRIVRYGGLLLGLAVVALGLGYPLVVGATPANLIHFSIIALALYALVLIEQVYRNARRTQRIGLKYLCLSLGGVFGYTVFLFSDAALSGVIDSVYFGVRGFVLAMCVPLLGLAAQRSPAWSSGIFVSRKVVFYTATLYLGAIYFLFVLVAGTYLRQLTGSLGQAAQALFFVAALLALFGFLFSDSLRARLRVFVNKHFFENRYDYRKEWLRLTDTLAAEDQNMPLRKRVLKALSRILESRTAVLWLKAADRAEYRSSAGWNVNPSGRVISQAHPLPEFLQKTGWIVDLAEYEEDPQRYPKLALELSTMDLDDCAFVIPLIHDDLLIGFVELSASEPPRKIDFEDRDLLKAAGQQVASYIVRESIMEQLAVGRQFEAFNRLTAYLMHDLKNVVAQQELVVQNAERHRDNPQFIEDAFATIGSSVARMRRLMEHMHDRSSARRLGRVELTGLIRQAVDQCSDRNPKPALVVDDEEVRVRADRDRLLMAFYHAIRNAQDATEGIGEVRVSLSANGSSCEIAVEDTGCGMDEEFVRERLFRPFDSTKGTQGMGIGAYQLRETIRDLGGSLEVQSEPGRGSRFIMIIPRESRQSDSSS